MFDYTYTFSVDTDLKISSWDINLARLKSWTHSEVTGAPYFNYFPRILQGENDVVEMVMMEGRSQSLKNYKIPCFFGIGVADLTIEPIKSGTKITGARIITRANSECMLSQQIIDVSKISTTLAHGVRNPLNAIKGAVVYLNEKYKSEAILQEFTQIIEEEINKLDTFVTRFLSSSFTDLDISDCNLNEVLETIVTLTVLQAKSKNIIFNKKLDDVPPLKLDKFHMQNAILNIINNAIEAMPGGGEISLNTGVFASNGHEYVVVSIADTGPGMSDSKISRLLKPLDGQRSGAGKGFGLSITREIVQRHGGFIEVKSGKGAGTLVTIYLPVA